MHVLLLKINDGCIKSAKIVRLFVKIANFECRVSWPQNFHQNMGVPLGWVLWLLFAWGEGGKYFLSFIGAAFCARYNFVLNLFQTWKLYSFLSLLPNSKWPLLTFFFHSNIGQLTEILWQNKTSKQNVRNGRNLMSKKNKRKSKCQLF